MLWFIVCNIIIWRDIMACHIVWRARPCYMIPYNTIWHRAIMMWYYMRWYDVVWCDIIASPIVSCGVTSYHMMRCGMISHTIVLHRIVSSDMISSDVMPYHSISYRVMWCDIRHTHITMWQNSAWSVDALYDVISYSILILPDIMPYHMIWCYVICCDVIWYEIKRYHYHALSYPRHKISYRVLWYEMIF